MNYRQKAFHYIFAIKCSTISIIASLLLLLVVVVISAFLPQKIENGQVTALLVGIIASIIATLILKISDKYAESCRAYNSILRQIDEVCDYTNSNVERTEDGDLRKHRFPIWRIVTQIKTEAEKLTYEKDYNVLYIALKKLVQLVYQNSAVDEIFKAVEELLMIKEKITSQ